MSVHSIGLVKTRNHPIELAFIDRAHLSLCGLHYCYCHVTCAQTFPVFIFNIIRISSPTRILCSGCKLNQRIISSETSSLTTRFGSVAVLHLGRSCPVLSSDLHARGLKVPLKTYANYFTSSSALISTSRFPSFEYYTSLLMHVKFSVHAGYMHACT